MYDRGVLETTRIEILDNYLTPPLQLESYVRESISNDCVGCLSLKCPHPGCGAAVGEDLILPVLATKANNDPDKAKYSQYLLRSYVEDCKGKRKWCLFMDGRSQSGELRYSVKWMMLKNEDDSEGVD
ncbi:hypothetical protein ACFX2A_044308 [Malus domestica]